MLTVSYNGNLIINYIEIKFTKNLNYVLNQNVNVTKQATFALSINLYLLQQHKWNTINVRPCRD